MTLDWAGRDVSSGPNTVPSCSVSTTFPDRLVFALENSDENVRIVAYYEEVIDECGNSRMEQVTDQRVEQMID